MRPRPILLALCLVAGAGCSGVPQEGETRGGADRPIPVSTPIDPQQSLELSGPYRHAPTGLTFAASAAGFERVVANRYDEEGNDIGIGYRRLWADARAEFTVYVYPQRLEEDGEPMEFEKEFRGSLGARLHGEQDIGLVAEAEFSALGQSGEAPARAAETRHRGQAGFGTRRVAATVTIYDLQPWRLKYFLTTHADQRDRAVAEVEELLREMKLPPLGVPESHNPEE